MRVHIGDNGHEPPPSAPWVLIRFAANVVVVSDPAVEPLASSALATAEAESAAHRSAVALQRRRLVDRDRRIVDAVRAGAGLERIATAASVTRAAASLVARREIRARPGRGGPYTRSRGVERALAAVADATRLLDEARSDCELAKVRRDTAIAMAVHSGCGVRSIAARLGLSAGTVSILSRAEREATGKTRGAVASDSRLVL